MNIVLIGIQGCGKGTLVSGLQKFIDFDLISVGQLLRNEVATGSELGRPSSLLTASKAFSGLTEGATLSHFGPPTAPSRTLSASLHFAIPSSVIGTPYLSILQPPISTSV